MTRRRIDQRDLLHEVGTRDDAIDAAVREFMRRTDPTFFAAVETMTDFGAATPDFVKLCGRVTRDAREIRAVLNSILQGA